MLQHLGCSTSNQKTNVLWCGQNINKSSYREFNSLQASNKTTKKLLSFDNKALEKVYRMELFNFTFAQIKQADHIFFLQT